MPRNHLGIVNYTIAIIFHSYIPFCFLKIKKEIYIISANVFYHLNTHQRTDIIHIVKVHWFFILTDIQFTSTS